MATQVSGALFYDTADKSVKRKKSPFGSSKEEFHLSAGL
jgi:hypothetical protein